MEHDDGPRGGYQTQARQTGRRHLARHFLHRAPPVAGDVLQDKAEGWGPAEMKVGSRVLIS